MAHCNSWGTLHCWCLTLLLLQGLRTYAKPLCGNMNTGGYTYPSGDITIKYGTTPLNITCNVLNKFQHLNIDGDISNFLYFTKNGLEVSSEYIHILNRTSISLIIEHPDKVANDNYSCMLKSNNTSISDEFICSNVVAVGVEVQDITDFSCLSRNYENLTCTWTGPNNFVDTKYNISYMVGAYRSQSKNNQHRVRGNRRGNSKGNPKGGFDKPHIDDEFNFPCPEGGQREEVVNQKKGDLKLKRYSCMWNMSTTPQYRQAHEFFYFTVLANNTFGSKLFNFTFNHYAHVLPSAPENLVAHSTSPHSIRLFWVIPTAMQHFKCGVYHRIMFSHKCDCENCENNWTLGALITDQTNKSEMEYNLTGLPFAHCLYDIRVSIRSAVNDSDGDFLWSNNATYVERTMSKIPSRPPKTNQGSFEIVNNLSNRDAFIYWQRIRKEEENGQNMTYCIEEASNTNLRMCSKKTYALFKGLLFKDSYTFYIWSQNSEGRSLEKSVVYVPGHLGSIKQPFDFVKVAHNDELFELSWKHPATNKTITNYTIFWCEYTKDRPFQCEGKLNWTEVSNITTSYNKTLPKTNSTYQFAISANSLTSSSGMLWAECTVIPDRNMGKMKNIWINRVASNFIELGWKLDCYDRIGTIKGYIIYYCPIQSPSQIECKGPDKNVTVYGDTYTVSATITDLTPYTTYRLTAAVMSVHGTSSQLSDPLYNTTAEAAPSSPPVNFTAINVTNNSISLSWLPPEHKNGVVRYYQLSYNGNVVIAERTQTTLYNLESYKEYNISLQACTVACSPSENITKTTLMSYPGFINQPKVSYQNGTFVTVEWEKPQPPRGRIDFYEVLYSSQQLSSTNNSKPYKTTTENKFDIENCDDTFYVSVRAVNVLELESKELKGEWSKPLQGLCRLPDTSWMYIVFPVIGFILFSVLFYIFRQIWAIVKQMQDVKYVLPPINDAINQEMKSVKSPEPDNEQNFEDHHDLLGLKVHNENSSGCSSGHESVSESLQSTTLNSDSGTEQPRSPSPSEEHVTNHSLRLRKMPVTKSGYVKADAIPQINWNKPVSTSGNYCVLGIDSPNNTESDSPYVPFNEHAKFSNDLPGPPDTFMVTNEVNPPTSGYVPYCTQEPPERNSCYVVAGIPPKEVLVPDFLSSPPEEKSMYVRATPDIALKASVLPWQQTGVELPSIPKPGYVCVGDVPRMKHNPEVSINKGYVPHSKFEAKSLKED